MNLGSFSRFLRRPDLVIALFWLLTILTYNWYPFNAGEPYSPQIITSSPDATRYLILSHSVEVFVSTFFALMIPLSYVAWKIRGFVFRRRVLVSVIALALLGFAGMVVMMLPAYLRSLASEDWALGMAAPGFNLLLLYSTSVNLIFHGGLLVAFSIYCVYGSLSSGLEETGGFFWAIFTAVAILLIDFVVGAFLGLLIDRALLDLTNCHICLYPYFRGWHPEAIRLVEEALQVGKEVIFGKPPTWGQLLAETLKDLLAGAILVRYLRGHW